MSFINILRGFPHSIRISGDSWERGSNTVVAGATSSSQIGQNQDTEMRRPNFMVHDIAYTGSRERFRIVLEELSGKEFTVEYIDLSQISTFIETKSNIKVLWVEFGEIIDSRILDLFPTLELLVSSTTGLTHIDTLECRNRKIQVLSLANFKDITSQITSTAELAWLLILAVWRKIALNFVELETDIHQIQTLRELNRGSQLKNRRIGIIGYGRIGRQISRYAKAFEMNIDIYDPKITELTEDFAEITVHNNVEQLLKSSDIVVICASQSEAKQEILSRQLINLINKEAVVVNVARGSLWDESAIYEALIEGRISGVGVDVYHAEENRTNNSNPLFRELDSKLNLIATPHIGGATIDAQEFVTRELAKKIRLHFLGE